MKLAGSAICLAVLKRFAVPAQCSHPLAIPGSLNSVLSSTATRKMGTYTGRPVDEPHDSGTSPTQPGPNNVPVPDSDLKAAREGKPQDHGSAGAREVYGADPSGNHTSSSDDQSAAAAANPAKEAPHEEANIAAADKRPAYKGEGTTPPSAGHPSTAAESPTIGFAKD